MSQSKPAWGSSAAGSTAGSAMSGGGRGGNQNGHSVEEIAGTLPNTLQKAKKRLNHFLEENKMLDQQLEALEEQLVLAEDELAEADHESMALQDKLSTKEVMDEQARRDQEALMRSAASKVKEPWTTDDIPDRVLEDVGTVLDDPRPSAMRLEGLLPAENYASLKKYKERMERWFHKSNRPPTPPPEPAQARRVITVHTGGDLALKFTMPPSQKYTVAQLLQDVCLVLGVRHQDFVLQLKFSRALIPEQDVEDALIESALLGSKAGKETLDPKQLFQLFDKDNSGEIDLQEFVQMFMSMNHGVREERISALFSRVDVDGDGTIVYSEFVEAWPWLLRAIQDMMSNELEPLFLIPTNRVSGEYERKATVRQLRASDLTPELAWEIFDRDASQSIEFNEFADVFKRYLKSNMSYNKLRKVFRIIDRDGNGSIDYGEFVDNWELVVAEIENTVDVLDSEEVLDELGQVLGLSVLRKVPQGPLPGREKSIVRSTVAFASWLIIFLLIIFTRRDLAGSYRMSFGMRQQSTLEPFGGPRFDDNGVMQVDTGQTGYTVTPLQPYYMFWRLNYDQLLDEVDLWRWANGPMLNTLFQRRCDDNEAGANCTTGISGFSNRAVGLFRITREDAKERACPPQPDSTEQKRIVACDTLTPSPLPRQFTVEHNATQMANVLDQLERTAWVRRDTERVRLQGTLYNANVNRFLAVNYDLAISVAGRFVTSSSFHPLRIDMFATSSDRAILALEAGSLFFVVFMALQDVKRLRLHRQDNGDTLSFFTGNMLNVTSLIFTFLYILSILLRFVYYFLPSRNDFDILTPRFIDLNTLYRVYSLAFDMEVFCVLLAVFRLMNYIQHGSVFRMLWTTLSRAAVATAYFLVLFVVLLMGFVLVGYTVFGPDIHQHHNLFIASRTSLLMTLGTFNEQPLVEAAPGWASVFVFVHYFALFFVFRNVFVALLNDTYRQVMYTARRTFKYSDSVWSMRGVIGAMFPPLEPRKPGQGDEDEDYQHDLEAFVGDLEREEEQQREREREEEELAYVLGQTAKRGDNSDALRSLLNEVDKGEEKEANGPSRV